MYIFPIQIFGCPEFHPCNPWFVDLKLGTLKGKSLDLLHYGFLIYKKGIIVLSIMLYCWKNQITKYKYNINQLEE